MKGAGLMGRNIGGLLLVLGVILSAAATLFALEGISSLSCDMTIDSPMTGKMTGKMFIKGEKSRVEMEAQGTKTINIIEGDKAYSYMPDQNIAMVLPLAQAKEQVPMVKDYKTDCQRLGEETIDGRICGIYDCVEDGNKAKLWVAQDLDFPVKIEAAGATTTYRNINIGVALEDSLFVLPAGVEVQDISQMIPNMAGMDLPSGNMGMGSGDIQPDDSADYNPADQDYLDVNRMKDAD